MKLQYGDKASVIPERFRLCLKFYFALPDLTSECVLAALLAASCWLLHLLCNLPPPLSGAH